MRLRNHNDGSITISRYHKETVDELDKNYIRVGNKLKWFPIVEGTNHINDLSIDLSNGCYIVGKGESLDKVTKESFKLRIPIFCINHSVTIISQLGLDNKIIATQFDAYTGKIDNGNYDLIVSAYVDRLYKDRKNKYIDIDCGLHTSIEYLLRLITERHCPIVYLIGFDSCTSGSMGYAKKLGLDSSKNNFSNHLNLIRKYFDCIDIHFLTEEDL